MKKSDFIEKVLKHDKNTVFVSEAIIERTLEIFEDLGMLPPTFYDEKYSKETYGKFVNIWEPEDEKK